LIEFALALVASIILIHKAGDLFVDSACGIARALGVSQVTIALTLIAFATSAPEFFTSLIAVGLGKGGLSYGNVVGSNIVNIALVLAVAAIFGIARIDRKGLNDGLAMLGIGGALAVMSLDGTIEPVEGISLLVFFTLFMWFVIKRERTGVKNLNETTPKKRVGLRKLFLLFTLGTAGVIIGARLLVFGASGIAEGVLVAVGMTKLEAQAAVGFTLVAVGTSIPELATILLSVRKKLHDISIGTVIGSNIFNAAFVVGSAALVGAAKGVPLGVDLQGMSFSNPMMLLSSAMLLGFMWKRKRLRRVHGMALLAMYVIYLVGLTLFYAW